MKLKFRYHIDKHSVLLLSNIIIYILSHINYCAYLDILLYPIYADHMCIHTLTHIIFKKQTLRQTFFISLCRKTWNQRAGIYISKFIFTVVCKPSMCCSLPLALGESTVSSGDNSEVLCSFGVFSTWHRNDYKLWWCYEGEWDAMKECTKEDYNFTQRSWGHTCMKWYPI